MHKYKLILSYDGTNYSGWQLQPNALSVQECLEKALSTYLKAEIRVTGAGRTDAGAHALGQAAHFASPILLDLHRSHYAINSLLPLDIRLKELSAVPEDFHARFSATGKTYHYHVWTEKTIEPFCRLYRHYYPRTLSIPLLREAAALFIGKKDFKTFANVGSSAKTSIRCIQRIDVVEEEGGLRFEFEGDGFLYKMVRNIVGTLLEVGAGKKEIRQIEEQLLGKDRRLAGAAAPAKGLFLIRVHYPDIFSNS